MLNANKQNPSLCYVAVAERFSILNFSDNCHFGFSKWGFFEINVSLFCASVFSLFSSSKLNKYFKAVFVQPNSCHFNY